MFATYHTSLNNFVLFLMLLPGKIKDAPMAIQNSISMDIRSFMFALKSIYSNSPIYDTVNSELFPFIYFSVTFHQPDESI